MPVERRRECGCHWPGVGALCVRQEIISLQATATRCGALGMGDEWNAFELELVRGTNGCHL
jgi:hypothetical protein